MGLDMYARKVKASLIGDKQIDIETSDYIDLPKEREGETPEERSARWAYQETIMNAAKERGAGRCCLYVPGVGRACQPVPVDNAPCTT